ncbi:hypothetical protein DFJ74DRAFT_667500 [Hyaloraphidium curvatum]|nr:hypothetical protein DFJ74DRAFT_667500 [Hyaloraphidium curvatum]
MRGSSITVLLLVSAASSAVAFQNTAPLMVWSGKRAHPDIPAVAFVDESSLASTLKPFVGDCEGVTLVIDQPGVHFATVKKHITGSFVKRSMDEAQYSITIPYFGTIDGAHTSNYDAVLQTISGMCPNAQFFTDGEVRKGEAGMSVVPVTLPALPVDDFTTNDNKLSELVDSARKIAGDKWTVIYTSKISARVLTKRQLPANYTGPWGDVAFNDRPFFQKYWVLNTGMFQAIFAMIPVILIMWYGVTWVSAIQTPTRQMPKKEGAMVTRGGM